LNARTLGKTLASDDMLAAQTSDEVIRLLVSRYEGVRVHTHPPITTVEQSRTLRGEIDGGHVKNLFLRDKKHSLYLITLQEDRQFETKRLRDAVHAQGNLSFANAELLMLRLGVQPGAVTPLALINDPFRAVAFWLDDELCRYERINVLALVNTVTLSIEMGDFHDFMNALSHPANIFGIF
jgi:Ala-tRNA(Pro) deacylase